MRKWKKKNWTKIVWYKARMDPMCSFYVQTHLHDPKPEHQLKTAAPHTPGMVYSLNEGQKRFLRFEECTCDCDCCCCSLWLPALTLVHCLSLALAFSLSPFIPVHVCMGASMYLCIPKPVRESKVHKVREWNEKARARTRRQFKCTIYMPSSPSSILAKRTNEARAKSAFAALLLLVLLLCLYFGWITGHQMWLSVLPFNTHR